VRVQVHVAGVVGVCYGGEIRRPPPSLMRVKYAPLPPPVDRSRLDGELLRRKLGQYNIAEKLQEGEVGGCHQGHSVDHIHVQRLGLLYTPPA
jgi:hypothetical protein